MANYIYCLVPMCRNTIIKTPNKAFFRVPYDPVIRKKWCDAMKRDPKKNGPLSSKTNRHVCEDHFELETDMENYTRYKLQGGRKFLKPGVVPHVFECQKNKGTPPPRERTIKRQRKEMVDELLDDSVQTTSPAEQCLDASIVESSSKSDTPIELAYDESVIIAPSHANKSIQKKRRNFKSRAINTCPTDIKDSICSPIKFVTSKATSPIKLTKDVANKLEHELTGRRLRLKRGVLPTVFDCQPNRTLAILRDKRTTKKRIKKDFNFCLIDDIEDLDEAILPDTEDCIKSVQTNLDLSKNDVTQTTTNYVHKEFQYSLNEDLDSLDSLNKTDYCILGLPIKAESENLDSHSEIVSDSFQVLENNETSNEDYTSEELIIAKFIESKPKEYIGVPPKKLYLIKFWAKELSISLCNIYLTLTKIKNHSPFFRIGDEFQISEECASQIFIETLPVLESCLKHLIFMPKQINKFCMPPAFRENFLNVSSIIDFLEVEIEEPLDPIQQALTWNDFMQANTLKYLVVCTPDGCVSFVSKGFGGSITDKVIVESSGLLEKVPIGTQIMTDRDFENIDPILAGIQCKLVRPPRLDSQFSAEVHEEKRIASLRTIMEKLTGRFKDYSMLKPHACINRSLIDYMDSIVNVCAGLINLKDDLIKI